MCSKIIRNGVVFLVSLFLFLFIVPKVLAVTITVSNCPLTIDSSAFNLDVFIDGASDGNNYLRIDLYKDGTTNYFGETFNGSEWYGGSTGTSYFLVNIINSTASATLQGRVGNPPPTEYLGPGNYKLRVRRYTASGNQASNDQQNPVDVNIQLPTPTPTPTPTGEPNSCGGTCGSDSNCEENLVCYQGYCRNSSCNTDTDCVCSTATSVPVSTFSPIPTPTSTSTKIVTSTPSSISPTEEVLGIQGEQAPSPSATPTSQEESQKKFPFFAILLIIGGIACMAFPIFILLKKSK